MAEGGCTTCCALLSAAFVLIGCAEPLAISTSESMIVLLHFFTTRRQAQLPDSLTPTAAVTVGWLYDAAKERPLRIVFPKRTPLVRCATHAPFGENERVHTPLREPRVAPSWARSHTCAERARRSARDFTLLHDHANPTHRNLDGVCRAFDL